MPTLSKQDYGSANLVTPQSAYVGEDLQAIQGASTALESAYQRERSNFNKVNLAVNNVKRLDRDEDQVSGRIGQYTDTLADIKQGNAFETMGTQIDQATSNFATDKVVQKAQQNYDARQAAVDRINKDPNFRSQDERNNAIRLADARYAGVQEDEETGNIFGDYEGYNISKRTDVLEKVNALGAGYKADTLAQAGVAYDSNGKILMDDQGRILTKSGEISTVSEQQIRNDLRKAITADPDSRASMETDFELATPKSNPEYYTNGVLNAEGSIAKEAYIKSQIDDYTDMAAEKYGFRSQKSQLGAEYDKTGAANRALKLEAEVTTSTDQTTLQVDKGYDPDNHTKVIKKLSGDLVKLEKLRDESIKAQDGRWTRDLASQYYAKNQERNNREFQYNLVKNKALESQAGKDIQVDLSKRTGLPADSDIVQAAMAGDFDPIAKQLTGGLYDYDQWMEATSGPNQPFLPLPAAIKAIKGSFDDLIKDTVEGTDVSYTANVLTITNEDTGKDLITERLTNRVNVNPSSFVIDDGTGKEVPLDQYQQENGLNDGYEVTVNLLKDRIGGRNGYFISYKPKGKDAEGDGPSDKEQLSRVIYPSKASPKLENQMNEEVATLALESSGKRLKDDRSPVNFALDAKDIGGAGKDVDLYQSAQKREAELRFSNAFANLEREYLLKKSLTPGSHDIHLPIGGKYLKVKVDIATNKDGFTTINVVDPNSNIPLLRNAQSSLRDVYVELLKTSLNPSLVTTQQ